MTRLLKLVAGPLSGALEGSGQKSVLDTDLSEIVPTLLENLDSDEGQAFTMEMVGMAYFEGKELKGRIETHFSGRIGDMIELLIEQIKFQYEDVFQKLGSRLGGQLPSALMKSQNTSKDSGQSGDSSQGKSRRSKK